VSSTPLRPPLDELAAVISAEPGIDLIAGQRNAVLAVPEAARSAVIAALLHANSRRPVIVAVPTGTMAQEVADDLIAFLGEDNVDLFPAWETLPFERVSPAVHTMGARMRTMWRLRTEGQQPSVIVAGTRALLQKLAPGSTSVDPIRINVGDRIDIDALCEQLVQFGYRREVVVEHRGEFARRGAIVDIFPSTADEPIRIDLWGDDVDRLTEFSVSEQRSTNDLATTLVFPAREVMYVEGVRERAASLVASEPWGREQWERLSEGQIFDGMESWLPWLTDADELLTDHLGDDALIVLVEPRRMIDRARDLLAEEDDLARALATSWARDENVTFPRLHVDTNRLLATDQRVPTISLIPAAEALDGPSVSSSGWSNITHDATSLTRRLNEMLSEKWRVIVAANSAESIPRLVELMRSHGLDFVATDDPTKLATPGAWVTLAPQSRGLSLPQSRIAIITETELSGRRRTRRGRATRARSSGTVFEDLQPGGYVVHAHHGVGKYEGMVKRAIGGVERDYLLIAYKGGDKLYVPTEQIGVLRQYVGGEAPSLHRMGGSDFARAKSRVRSAVREVAQELVVLYQRRVTAKGHAFAEDTPWQHEMEAAFPFIETPDQLEAIENIKADMEREVPMDRLLCGDVGFGKTEVKSGDIDCVIGTHRLLQESVEFKNLGLLVVDEEQRFGVQHKEAMKRLKTNVDVLSMSATPIPRTLEMSLVGIRDLSLLQTPPADRQPILTYVGEQSEQVAIEAIRRELLREGQVFWVHNRVQSIEERAAELREWVPEARVAVAHGQMDETRLEQIVLDFWEGLYDVLVCTTIIESGIDMPTVNTLVVERADLLGLGQMHQLRGRVGRSGQRAYAYLFHPRDKVLSEEAYERLRTIGETTDLGSGFKIAMRDLEIRGAGNLLGEAQSGHIAAVGYDLYCQMVTEAVSEMKGEPTVEESDIKVDITIDAHLPNDYVPSEDLRLEAYRKLASVRTATELSEIENEWTDRFGPLPAPAQSLLSVAALRVECYRIGITEIVMNGSDARLSPIELRASQTKTLRRLSPRAVLKESTGVLTVPIPRGENPAVALTTMLCELFEPDDH
jgi:transcription-repair coupling factor (superfamily II helicase)